MMTPHNEAKKEDISNIVIMPGDPLRAKYIAENFLTDYKLVNSVRNMFAYTGNYRGKRITVMASGMGMPSMGIYCYELYQFYNVEKIIRIGSCGTFIPDLKVLDIILVENSYTEGNFALAMNNSTCHLASASPQLNHIIERTAQNMHVSLAKGTTLCNEYFDPYQKDLKPLFERIPKDISLIGSEMEAFALFYTAQTLKKQASCLLTVVDSNFEKKEISAEERQTSLNQMIQLALESTLFI